MKSRNSDDKGFAIILAVVIAIIAIVLGYIIYSGNKSQEFEVTEASFEMGMDESADTLGSENKDVPVVDIYEDFSCHFCAILAEETDSDMLKAIEEGKLKVNIHTLNFLDRGNNNGHSTLSASAIRAIVENGEDSEVYWNYRVLLMERMEKIANRWSLDDFAKAAKDVGASDQTIEDIESGKYSEKAIEMAQTNLALLLSSTGTISSPRVLMDGSDIDPTNWVENVVGK